LHLEKLDWELGQKTNNINLHIGLGVAKHSTIDTTAMTIGIFPHPFGPPIEDYSHNMNLVGTLKKSIHHTINDQHWSRGGESIN